ncbi:nucleotidyltransferase family protein [Joostella sp. CR20]|uniref:nucleotidyltransferase family protein n=1 Tax=Joostella sp. CR20 TaxID=2804312 RepID=UPI00313E8590
MNNIAILILSAGASSRMGTPKQLLPWGDLTLLEHAIATANASTSVETFVVLGAHADEIQQQIAINATVLFHKNWKLGIGSSLAFGISQLANKSFDAVLIMLADQPFVSTEYINELLLCFQTSAEKIIASKFHENIGVPAVFSSEYFNDLKNLKGDVGAKKIIKSNLEDVKTVDGNAVVMDVDTVEMYKKAYKLKFDDYR